MDVPTLRRIAFLALRVSDDHPALSPTLREINTLVDRLKREVALGIALPPSEIRRLKRLLSGVPLAPSASSMIEAAMLDELRGLGRALHAG